MANQKHVFDFEGILNMDINQKNWREIKQKLDKEFGELKIGIAEGMAKADAEKYVKMLNQVFSKVEMPDIGVDDLKNQFDQIADNFAKAIASLHNIDTSALKNIEGSLDHIATQVDKIVDKVGKGVPKAAKSAVLSVKQLDDVLGKLGDSAKDIDDSLNFSVDGDVKKQSAALRKLLKELEQLEENRTNAARDGASEDLKNWLKRQQAMTKYVRVYENYIKLAKKPNKEFAELYNKILPKSYDAKTNLQNLADRRSGTYSEHKEPWAKEETLKKVLNVLQNGIKVEGKDDGDGGNKPPKPPAPPKNPKPAQGITVYRTVYEPDEPDDRTRSEILESWGGAEYWTNKKGVAETYADGQNNPVILKGNIVAEKPFVIDAKGHTWDKFQSMSAIRGNEEIKLEDVFPEIFTRIANGELKDPADIQAELNQVIKQLGHDVVEMRNVIDTNNPDSYKELSTTYSVLDDRILKIESAFAMEEQDRDGITTFEKKASKKNIPEYYKMPNADVSNNSLVEQTSLLEKIQKLTSYIDKEYLSAGKHLSDFLDDVQAESAELDAELKDILTTLHLIDDEGKSTFTVKRTGEEGGGTTHNGALISDDFVLIERGDYENVKNSHLPDATKEASQNGINVAEILGYIPSKYTKGFFDVQGVARGGNLFKDGVLSQEVVNATDEQLEQLTNAFIKARDYGFNIENGGNNVLYDKEKGFSFYDLEELSGEDSEFWKGLSESEKKLYAIEDLFSLFSGINIEHTNAAEDQNVSGFTERIKGIIESRGIVSPNDVDGSGRNYEDIYDDVFGGDGYDEADDIIALLQAEERAHRNNANAIREEADAQEELNNTKPKEPATSTSDFSGTSSTINSGALSEISAKIDGLATDVNINTVKDAIISAITTNNDGKISIDTTSVIEALSKIQIVQDNSDVAATLQSVAERLGVNDNKVSIDTEGLRSVLNAITYNVNVVRNGDESDNKIAIDESSLEATLTKVFANILNPQTPQNDSAPQQSSWALESTLQTVKGVLDGVRTNTAKIGTVKPPQTNSIAGSVLDNRLVEIKIVLDSINQKIAKGGVIATRGAVKQANAQSVEPEVKAQAARSNMMKSLTNDYKTLGKLAAQFASDGNLETKAMLDNLKEEISRKRQSLKLTMDENANLREKYSMAFDAEKRLLDAEKAQKEVNKNNKEAETTWKKQVKDAQRATGINAATSAANAGDQTVLRAIGTNGITNDIENKAKELSDQIRELRKLRGEIDKKGNQASDADRDNLSKQITKVKELKTEVDGYLKIHEKYSGENVTDLGDASGFGAAGTDEYWNNITEAIKNVSSGRVTINGLDADTGELTGTTKIAANTFAQWSATVDPITGRLSMLRTGIKKTETLMEQITRKTREIFTYFSGSSIIFKAFNEIKKGVQYVRDIDLALTELKKVTDETEETYDKFLETAAKTADKVGSTIQKVVSSTADWARLGYSMDQAAKFAETTQILMNVSEFTDVSQATDTLISSVQAFGYTAETSMDVVDLLNTIGK